MAAINIFVGLINLIPLLPFDGGHIAIATYEAIRSRPGKPYRADITKLLPLSYAVARHLRGAVRRQLLPRPLACSGAVFERRKTRQINVGKVPVGGDAPVSVQSMTTTKTADVEGTLQQIYALAGAGCDIVRCTCNET